MKFAKFTLPASIALLYVGAAVAGGFELDPGLAKHAKVQGLRGTLNAAVSDTMLELQTLMAEEFRKLYPQVKIQVKRKGSSTAPPALIEGTVQLGTMSRKKKNQETDAFEEEIGYPPTRFDVALDTLAVFVNTDNPISSRTRRRHEPRGHHRSPSPPSRLPRPVGLDRSDHDRVPNRVVDPRSPNCITGKLTL